MRFLEVGNLGGLIVMIALIMFSPAIIMTIIGFAILKKKKKAAKILFIISAVYTIIGLGICGSMWA